MGIKIPIGFFVAIIFGSLQIFAQPINSEEICADQAVLQSNRKIKDLCDLYMSANGGTEAPEKRNMMGANETKRLKSNYEYIRFGKRSSGEDADMDMEKREFKYIPQFYRVQNNHLTDARVARSHEFLRYGRKWRL